MKALVRKERQPGLRPEEVPEPEVGIGDVLIRVDRTGFCGTDLHSTNGTWFSKMKPVATFVLVAFLAATALPVWSKPLPPDASLNLKLAAPVKTWDEALPLGDGAMGVLLWGETNLLRLSLDRGDLWDERPSPTFLRVRDQFNWASLQRLVASNRIDEFNAICDANYDYNGSPTKLPAGRIDITLDPSQKVESFELNLATAEGVVHGKAAELARAFVNAADVEQPVALIRIHGPPLKEVRLKTHAGMHDCADFITSQDETFTK